MFIFNNPVFGVLKDAVNKGLDLMTDAIANGIVTIMNKFDK